MVAVFDLQHDVTFYVNGTLLGTVQGQAPADASVASWYIGTLDNSIEFFDGPIDDLQVYGHALSGEQAAFLYDNPGLTLAEVGELGIPYCFGDGGGTACPCANESTAPGEGCTSSAGTGMRIDASGTTSIAADDLPLTASNSPPINSGIFYAGTASIPLGNVLFDGLQCVTGSVLRFRGVSQTSGTVSDTGLVAQDPSGVYFFPGTTYFFQHWSRDVSAGSSPCGSGANFSPALSVTMSF